MQCGIEVSDHGLKISSLCPAGKDLFNIILQTISWDRIPSFFILKETQLTSNVVSFSNDMKTEN